MREKVKIKKKLYKTFLNFHPMLLFIHLNLIFCSWQIFPNSINFHENNYTYTNYQSKLSNNNSLASSYHYKNSVIFKIFLELQNNPDYIFTISEANFILDSGLFFNPENKNIFLTLFKSFIYRNYYYEILYNQFRFLSENLILFLPGDLQKEILGILNSNLPLLIIHFFHSENYKKIEDILCSRLSQQNICNNSKNKIQFFLHLNSRLSEFLNYCLKNFYLVLRDSNQNQLYLKCSKYKASHILKIDVNNDICNNILHLYDMKSADFYNGFNNHEQKFLKFLDIFDDIKLKLHNSLFFEYKFNKNISLESIESYFQLKKNFKIILEQDIPFNNIFGTKNNYNHNKYRSKTIESIIKLTFIRSILRKTYFECLKEKNNDKAMMIAEIYKSLISFNDINERSALSIKDKNSRPTEINNNFLKNIKSTNSKNLCLECDEELLNIDFNKDVGDIGSFLLYGSINNLKLKTNSSVYGLIYGNFCFILINGIFNCEIVETCKKIDFNTEHKVQIPNFCIRTSGSVYLIFFDIFEVKNEHLNDLDFDKIIGITKDECFIQNCNLNLLKGAVNVKKLSFYKCKISFQKQDFLMNKCKGKIISFDECTIILDFFLTGSIEKLIFTKCKFLSLNLTNFNSKDTLQCKSPENSIHLPHLLIEVNKPNKKESFLSFKNGLYTFNNYIISGKFGMNEQNNIIFIKNSDIELDLEFKKFKIQVSNCKGTLNFSILNEKYGLGQLKIKKKSYIYIIQDTRKIKPYYEFNNVIFHKNIIEIAKIYEINIKLINCSQIENGKIIPMKDIDFH